MLKVYSYKKCSTCRNAIQFLDKQGSKYKEIDIISNPPSKTDLERMLKLKDGNLKSLFNTSGELYRELKIKDKFPEMTKAQAFSLLSKHGKLVKRPFVIGADVGLLGFKETEWRASLS